MDMWEKMKVRFLSRFRREYERKTACYSLLKESLIGVDTALLHICLIKNKNHI